MAVSSGKYKNMNEILFLSQQPELIRKFLYEIMVLFSGLILSGTGKFSVTNYQIITDKPVGHIRIVQISDLHLREFGEKNADLIEAVRKTGPDLIAVTGDMVNKWAPSYGAVIELCRDLQEIAPVYYVLGNHELDQIKQFGTQIKPDLRNIGVNLLDNESVTAEVNGRRIDIGGLTDVPNAYSKKGKEFITRFTQSENFKLLLVHDPGYFDAGYKKGKRAYLIGKDIDAALCGHRHGGIYRLPGAGALYVPGAGFFPKLSDSITRVGNTDVVVSRGLGDSKRFPRLNNPPELVVVDIAGKR